MTQADDLQRLVERIEAAAGPDRELDCRIWCALSNANPEAFFLTCQSVVSDFGQWQASFYTAGLDAAMKLAPSGSRIILNIAEDGLATAIVAGTQGCAATAALALCAAALRARLNQETNHE